MNTQAPPGSEKILSLVGFVKWIAGARIIACFLGGIVAFTAGRMFDHHRTGRMGLIFMMAAGVGAMLFAVGPQLLDTLAGGRDDDVRSTDSRSDRRRSPRAADGGPR